MKTGRTEGTAEKFPRKNLSRRRFAALLAALSASPALLVRNVMGQKKSPESLPVTEEDLARAEKVIGLSFTDADRKTMLKDVADNLKSYETIREFGLENSVTPAVHFNPLLPGMTVAPESDRFRPARVRTKLPEKETELVFLPVTHLSYLLRTRQIRSLDLTKLYLERLKKYDKVLHCVITLTEDLALEQARRADEELRVGHYRGPLHGIPWGAKDLLAVKGYRTTWGAMPYKNQVINENATVVERLNRAGAVLVAKLSVGALAWGDVWFGGKTRNPWNPEQGSSGSSAGPAAATAAGLVGFAIGTETYGSIVSPSTRCGTTGLRPTFGRVSRYGCMALSWTMDKIGPICRTVEDCALVFQAIHGADDRDPTAVQFPFDWNPRRDPTRLRVGYLKAAFERDHDTKAFDDAALQVLRKLGFKLKPVEWPKYPLGALLVILDAEAAAAFDEITRNRQIDTMVRQGRNTWPNTFRYSRFIPAVEYINANRIRTLLMRDMAKVMADVDVVVTPTYGGGTLLLTNLTGHPAVVLPNGFRKDGTPVSITFIGNLYKESDLLLVARAYQEATDFHTKHPPLFAD